jgi:hypothetical protein
MLPSFTRTSRLGADRDWNMSEIGVFLTSLTSYISSRRDIRSLFALSLSYHVGILFVMLVLTRLYSVALHLARTRDTMQIYISLSLGRECAIEKGVSAARVISLAR